jgi:arylsulfatase A-like enzyme
MERRGRVYAAAAFLLLLGFLLTQFRITDDSRPFGKPADLAELIQRDDLNVLFILVDTLRADRLGSYGYERPTSPTLDKLAATGVRFANHMSQSSWTKTSMASVWTGMYPTRTGILRFNNALPETAVLPAEILRDAGFVTAGIWRNGWVAPTFGFDQGFDVYHRPEIGAMIDGVRREGTNPYAKIAGSDQDAAEGTIEFLRNYQNDRFFLYVHLMDAHQYLSDEESAIFGTSYSDLYDNSILWTDKQIAAMLAALDRYGLREKTLVVLASDHGEAFQEHGNEGHAKDLHREVIRTPWIISLPFTLDEPIVVDAMTENVDVWPTILDLLGQEPIDSSDGVTRLPEILTQAGEQSREAVTPPRPSFAQLDRTWGRSELEPEPLVAVTTNDGWRYMRSSGARAGAKLYETRIDPLERQNLMKEEGAQPDHARFDALIEEYHALPEPEWRGDVRDVELDDMQKGQLRAIGYSLD